MANGQSNRFILENPVLWLDELAYMSLKSWSPPKFNFADPLVMNSFAVFSKT